MRHEEGVGVKWEKGGRKGVVGNLHSAYKGLEAGPGWVLPRD